MSCSTEQGCDGHLVADFVDVKVRLSPSFQGATQKLNVAPKVLSFMVMELWRRTKMWIGDVRLKRSLGVKLARLLQDIVGHEVNQSV